jgi:TRAP-type C4-dicarboxylate transport system substrate-binding protein
MRQLIASEEEDQIKKLEGLGIKVTRPDLEPFKAKMAPAYQRIAAYAGEDNVKRFQEILAKMG